MESIRSSRDADAAMTRAGISRAPHREDTHGIVTVVLHGTMFPREGTRLQGRPSRSSYIKWVGYERQATI